MTPADRFHGIDLTLPEYLHFYVKAFDMAYFLNMSYIYVHILFSGKLYRFYDEGLVLLILK